MKRFYLIGFIFIAFALSANAQTVLSEDGKQLKDVESQIESVTKQRSELFKKREILRVRYSDDYKEIQELTEQINELDKTLVTLEIEKKSLLGKKLVKELPSNQIQLLKMIVVQNERIIELLEKLAKQ